MNSASHGVSNAFSKPINADCDLLWRVNGGLVANPIDIRTRLPKLLDRIKSMTINRVLSSLLLLFALLPTSIQAKTNLCDWTNVRRIKTGPSIVVSTKMGDVYAGDLKEDGDGSLVLLAGCSCAVT